MLDSTAEMANGPSAVGCITMGLLHLSRRLDMTIEILAVHRLSPEDPFPMPTTTDRVTLGVGSSATLDNSTYIAKAHLGIPNPHICRTRTSRSLASTTCVSSSIFECLRPRLTSRSCQCLLAFLERDSNRCELRFSRKIWAFTLSMARFSRLDQLSRLLCSPLGQPWHLIDHQFSCGQQTSILLDLEHRPLKLPG